MPIEKWGSEPAGLWRSLGSAANVLAVLLSEYRRAIAAERRYRELRRTDAFTLARSGITTFDGIARRVFAEMYSDTSQKR
jgi:hypothetical protein